MKQDLVKIKKKFKEKIRTANKNGEQTKRLQNIFARHSRKITQKLWQRINISKDDS